MDRNVISTRRIKKFSSTTKQQGNSLCGINPPTIPTSSRIQDAELPRGNIPQFLLEIAVDSPELKSDPHCTKQRMYPSLPTVQKNEGYSRYLAPAVTFLVLLSTKDDDMYLNLALPKKTNLDYLFRQLLTRCEQGGRNG